jgi:hypothetical protein
MQRKISKRHGKKAEHLKQKNLLWLILLYYFEGKEEEMIAKLQLKFAKKQDMGIIKLLMVFKTDSKLIVELTISNGTCWKQVYNYKSLYSNYLTVNNVTFIKSYIRTSFIMFWYL